MPQAQSPFLDQWGKPAKCASLVPRSDQSRFTFHRSQPKYYELIWREIQAGIEYSVFHVILRFDSIGATDCWDIKSTNTGRILFSLNFTEFLDRETWPDPDMFAETLDQFHQHSAAGRHFLNFLRWVPPTIEAFYHPSRPDFPHEFTWAVKRAKLCALFLMWFDDFHGEVEQYQSSRFGLFCLYHEALAYLYENESEWMKQLPPHGWAGDWHLGWEYRKILRRWHQVCRDPINQQFFQTTLHGDQPHAMLDLIAHQHADQCRLRRLVRETSDGRDFALDHVARWFLRQYDVPTAESIHNAVNSLHPLTTDDPTRHTPDTSGLLQPSSRRKQLAWYAGLVIVGPLLLVGGLLGPTVILGQYLVLAATITAYLVFACLIVSLWRQPALLQLAMPRLIGGMFAGHTAVILGGEFWRVIHELRNTPGRWLVLVGGSLTLAAVGLFSKVTRPDRSPPIAWRNVRHWLLERPDYVSVRLPLSRTLSLSILTSTIVVDLMGNVYLKETGAPTASPFRGLTGPMYPFLAIAFAALALFVATFVQLLWEDQPLTEPWS